MFSIYITGGQEYDENEDYPYNANINYPTYILPQHTYSNVQDLTAYGAPQDDVDNQDKFHNKRSPLKKPEIKDLLQSPHKTDPTKSHREAKKLENDVSNVKEKTAEIKVSTTESSKNVKSQDTKKQ